jgi:hypothetical protein
MRKLLLPAAAAAALLAAAPMTAASAASHDVLTTGKVGGPNVKVGALLQASLKSNTTAKFLTSKSSGVTCKKVTFTDKVISNPPQPGTAKESLTKQIFVSSSCSVKGIQGATSVKSVKVNKLPYRATISGKKGFPVTVSGTSTTITLNTTLGPLSCTYTANGRITKGNASNTTQTISFNGQKFTRSHSPLNCPKTGTFSATFGPVVDTSAKGHPHVFVN